MGTVEDVPIFAALDAERRSRTGVFAPFALEAPVEILSAGPASGDLAGPGTSIEIIEECQHCHRVPAEGESHGLVEDVEQESDGTRHATYACVDAAGDVLTEETEEPVPGVATVHAPVLEEQDAPTMEHPAAQPETEPLEQQPARRSGRPRSQQ
jgi:hypothetical protein